MAVTYTTSLQIFHKTPLTKNSTSKVPLSPPLFSPSLPTCRFSYSHSHLLSHAFLENPTMRHVLLSHASIATPPLLISSASPPPITLFTTTAANVQGHHNMLVSVFLALFLPCAGMIAVFVIYICLLWCATKNQTDIPMSVKPVGEKGLSASELEKLPKVAGKELVMGTECAVCLDEIASEQAARLVPGCNHGFHLECADTWLSKNPMCPVCRAKLESKVIGGE